jgi:hypothetical protein
MSVARPDFPDLLVTQDSLRDFLFSPTLPALGDHVSRVGLNGSGEQVRRVDAWRIVAMVADKQFLGEGAVEQLVGKPVGENFDVWLIADP